MPSRKSSPAGDCCFFRVGAALLGVDVVVVGEDALVVGLRVLEGDVDLDAALRTEELQDLLVHHVAAAVELADEVPQPTLVAEDLLFRLVPLVPDRDLETAVQERQLAHARRERVVVEDRVLEDRRVRREVHPRAPAFRLAHL
jgi:hypothetical protein